MRAVEQLYDLTVSAMAADLDAIIGKLVGDEHRPPRMLTLSHEYRLRLQKSTGEREEIPLGAVSAEIAQAQARGAAADPGIASADLLRRPVLHGIWMSVTGAPIQD